jgi:hypothetical protein
MHTKPEKSYNKSLYWWGGAFELPAPLCHSRLPPTLCISVQSTTIHQQVAQKRHMAPCDVTQNTSSFFNMSSGTLDNINSSGASSLLMMPSLVFSLLMIEARSW